MWAQGLRGARVEHCILQMGDGEEGRWSRGQVEPRAGPGSRPPVLLRPQSTGLSRPPHCPQGGRGLAFTFYFQNTLHIPGRQQRGFRFIF